MITRQQYMADSNLFDEYYSQFVNNGVKHAVLNFIGRDLLLNSKDEHLNDIPLNKWDRLTGFIFRGSEIISRPSTLQPIDINLLREANEGVCPATLVIIYKQGAKQLIKELKK